MEIWRGYWADRASGLLRPSDRSVVTRWIANVNRYLTLITAADAEPIVAGSTGQQRPNPLYKLAYEIEGSLRSDEVQLGIGPKNGLALGLLAIQERRSLADMNAAYSGGADGGNDRAEEEDPRLTVIPGETG